MMEFKKHIALLLLVGFSFPQVVNSVHYFVVPHYNKTGAEVSNQITAPIYHYHSCDYHLAGINGILFSNCQSQQPFNKEDLVPQQFYYSFDHNIEFAFHYQLRGPPEKIALF